MKTAVIISCLAVTDTLSDKEWRTKRVSRTAKLDPTKTHRIYASYDKHTADRTQGITILDWWSKKKAAPVTRKLSDECGGCWITTDQSLEKQADGILLDNTRYVRNSRLGKIQKPYFRTPELYNRNPDQYWIFWPREAASKASQNACEQMKGGWDSAFNLTTSYRQDSDIPREFGDYQAELKYSRFKKKDGQWSERMSKEEHLNDIMAQKNPKDQNYVSWLVSNCDATGGADLRFQYVQRMIADGLKLDGFGHCFDKVLSGSPWAIYMSDRINWGDFAKYKFYLAFENSIHCTDYLSEKFWRNSLRQGLVPVVSGAHRDDVKRMAPPNSYIHAEDFTSPKALVDYLSYLNSNDTAYLEYHAWRRNDPDWTVTTYAQPEEKMICGICQELNERKALGFPKRIIPSVASWWWMNQNDEQCTAGNIMPEWVQSIKPVSMSEIYDEKLLIKNQSEHQIMR